MTAIFKENDAPPTPPAGYVAFYCKTDGKLYYKDDAGVELPIKPVGGGTGDLLSDGTVPLTANWDVGAWKIIAAQLESDIATGTAPFIVASQTLVTNLNAEFLGGTDLAGIQALIDAAVVGLFDDKGNYDASTNTPDLDTSPSGIKKGDVYTTSVAGTFFSAAVEVGDVLRALQDDPTTLAHWAIVQTNLDAASVKTLYESNADTNAFTDAEQAKLTGIEATADVTDATNVAAAGAVMDGDFSADEGMMRKSAAGTYTTIKTNLAAAVDPTVNDDSGDGYGIYSVWVNTTDDKIFFCLDASVGAAVWQEVGAGGGGGMTPVFKSANYTAVAGELVYCLTATAAAAFTITLPATPVAGQSVSVWDAEDAAQDYNITVARNGQTIQGVASDVYLNVSGGRWDFAFDGTTWQASYVTPGASGVVPFIQAAPADQIVKYFTISNLADDAVISFNFGKNIFAGQLIISANNEASFPGTYGIMSIRAASSNAFCVAIAAGANLNVTTGVLTGTTGTDGKFTVSTHTDNKVYFENRRGAALTLAVQIVGASLDSPKL